MFVGDTYSYKYKEIKLNSNTTNEIF